MVYVLPHLPAGFPRTLRCNDGALTDLAYRCLPVLLSGDLEPTARAIAERFERNKDTANKALRSLEVCGYVRRWRVSAGRDAWLHFVVVTDEPYAWDIDPALAARIVHFQDQTLAHFQEHLGIAATEAAPTPPQPDTDEAPRDEFAQVTSCPDSSDPTESDIPKKFLAGEGTSPLPPNSGQRVPRQVRRDPLRRSIARWVRTNPELEPHMPSALALLEGLRFAPMDRARGAHVLAAALHSGRSWPSLVSWLTDRLDTAHDRRRVQNWRIDELATALGLEPVFRRKSPPTPGSRAVLAASVYWNSAIA